MGAVVCENRNIDMICQICADGTIIPMKMRVVDDDGAHQEFKIKSYKNLTYKGNVFNLPDVGPVCTTGICPFECKIDVFGVEKTINLFYNVNYHIWVLSPQTRL